MIDVKLWRVDKAMIRKAVYGGMLKWMEDDTGVMSTEDVVSWHDDAEVFSSQHSSGPVGGAVSAAAVPGSQSAMRRSELESLRQRPAVGTSSDTPCLSRQPRSGPEDGLVLAAAVSGPRRARTRSEPERMRRRPAIGTSSDTPCLGARRAPTRAVVGKDVAPTTRQTDRQTATTQEREEPLAHEGRGMTYRLSSSYPQSGPRGTAGEGSLGSQKGRWV